MSKALKKLREEKLSGEGVPYKDLTLKQHLRITRRSERKTELAFPPLSGMSQIEELERNAAEAAKEQNSLQNKLKEKTKEKKKLLENLISTLDKKADEERKDMNAYNKLAYETELPTVKKLFTELANEEQEHFNKLRWLRDELKRETNKLP